MTPICPSPLPPYHRPERYRVSERFSDDATANLENEVSYLDAVDAGGVIEIALPSGRFQRERHAFFVPKDKSQTSANFLITGTFYGYDALVLNRIGHAVEMEWDGYGWHVIGGNAEAHIQEFDPTPNDEITTNTRFKNGVFQLRSADDNLWYTVSIRLVGGALTLSVEGLGEQ